MFGLKTDWIDEPPPRYMTLDDYDGGIGRWCPGCGDFAVLTAVQKILRDEQLPTEKVVCVSGIGCSSRFPHYMSTYGFHGLHGRAFPVACGVRARRPDLAIWVATGDGDCCSIGAGHWVHAVRYNMDMVVMLFDNAIYGLTKKQTSPTSPLGISTNTHPRGSILPPINPIVTTLGMSNVSFVAQTVDWNPVHLQATLHAAYKHKGFSFVRILQRCPTYVDNMFEELQNDPAKLLLLNHEKGINGGRALDRMYKTQTTHDPSNLLAAQALAQQQLPLPIGLIYHNPDAVCYDDFTQQGLGATDSEKLAAIEKEFDRFSI